MASFFPDTVYISVNVRVCLAQDNMSSFQQRNDDVYIVYIQPRHEVTDPSQRKTRRESYYLSTLIVSHFCIGLSYSYS